MARVSKPAALLSYKKVFFGAAILASTCGAVDGTPSITFKRFQAPKLRIYNDMSVMDGPDFMVDIIYGHITI